MMKYTTFFVPYFFCLGALLFSISILNGQEAAANETERDVAKQSSIDIPVSLNYFKAVSCENKSVCLFWETLSESENSYFSIEHSTDGKQWTTLEEVAGAGFSLRSIVYSALHAIPVSGINYYRLKQTSFNGHSSFSEVVSFGIERFEPSRLHVYPNPATTQISIRAKSPLETAEFRVTTLLGQDVTHSTQLLKIGDDFVQIDIANLPKGNYFLFNQTQAIRFQKR